MPKSNKEKQREYKARMRDRGLVQVTEWVPAASRGTVRRLAEKLRKEAEAQQIG